MSDDPALDLVRERVEGRTTSFLPRYQVEHLLRLYDDAMKANAILENICEHMATEHIVFGVVGSDEKTHPDWCVQCVFDGMRDLLAERAQWGHEKSHGEGTFEECPMPSCQEVRAAIERGRNRI